MKSEEAMRDRCSAEDSLDVLCESLINYYRLIVHTV